MTDYEPLEEAERRLQRPTAEGSRKAWLALEGPVHAPSLAAKTVPPRDWCVEDLIPMRAVTLLSGDGGTGKSTLALQLACSAVLGRRWLGRETKPGRVAYLSCEDDIDELHRRLEAICAAEDWNIGDLEGLELFDRVGRDSAVMARRDGFGAGWEESPWWISFSDWLQDFGPRLVVLDSLYDFFVGNQLDQASARTFMGMLRQAARDADCAVITLWHPSKSGMESGDGTSGNVSFRNACRSMLYLERDREATGPNPPLILRGKKANYGPAAGELIIQWEAGRFVPVAPAGAAGGVLASIERRKVEAVFLDLLDAVMAEGRHLSSSRTSNNYAPTIFSRRPDNLGYRKTDFERAMEVLFASKRIKVGQYGRRGDERSEIVRTAGEAGPDGDR